MVLELKFLAKQDDILIMAKRKYYACFVFGNKKKTIYWGCGCSKKSALRAAKTWVLEWVRYGSYPPKKIRDKEAYDREVEKLEVKEVTKEFYDLRHYFGTDEKFFKRGNKIDLSEAAKYRIIGHNYYL